jgi:tetratricopeptide (TPR) repeat protein
VRGAKRFYSMGLEFTDYSSNASGGEPIMDAMRGRRIGSALLTLALVLGCATPANRGPGAVAAAYAAQGRWQEATREIEIAVRQHPRDAELRRQAASIHRQAGNADGAIRHLEAGIQLAPSDAEIWIELGDLEKGRENIADAYLAYRRAAELAPEDLRAVSGLALTADSLGFEDEADDAYARWAELERDRGRDEAPKRER